jgi:transposase
MENPTNTTKLPSAASAVAARPQRWSARRKQEIVLRLLRGEPIEAIARELGIEPYRLERWRDRALIGMAAGLKERADDDPGEVDLAAAHQRVGELSMENELLRAKITHLENGVPFHRARSRT